MKNDPKGMNQERQYYRRKRYRVACWPLLCLLLWGCGCGNGTTKTINKRVTLWRQDKIPYGTWVAWHFAQAFFPDAEMSRNSKSPVQLSGGEGGKCYVSIAPWIDPEGSEVTALLNYAGSGNQVFLSALYFGDTLLNALHVKDSSGAQYDQDTLRLSIYHPRTEDSLSFTYPGFSRDRFITQMDTPYTSVLGRDRNGRPDFIRLSYKGGGAVFLHFAPLAFSNFFLLHKNNKEYFENIFSYMPHTVNEVIWDDYFRYYRVGYNNFSAFRYIFSSQPLSWAFGLLLLLFALIYLFESKRRQRMVPRIPGLQNNSLDFVKTIGRLYYQRRDNRNLAGKMAAHFQDHLRTQYNMNFRSSDPDFIRRLSHRTGIAQGDLQLLLSEMERLPAQESVSDAELLDFQRRLEEFYKHI